MSVSHAAELAPGEMTFAEWGAMPEDEPGELVNGRLVEEEAPDLFHETIVASFVFTRKLWLAGRGGFVFGSEGKFAVAPGRGRKPDVTVYLPGSKKPPARGVVRTPPDIAIEVVSPTPRDGRRDRIEKPGEYAAFGVRWYYLPLPMLCATALALSCAPASAPPAAEMAGPAVPPAAPSSTLAAPSAEPSSSAGAVVVPAALEADLLAIAASYPSMSRADGTWWAPEDCRAPVHPAFASKAEAGGHGRKLYTLFVKDIASYAALSGRRVDVERGPAVKAVKAMSQVIVKEAWTPIESAKWQASCRAAAGSGPSMPSYLAPVVMDDKEYRACEPAGIFVMYRPAVAAADSDEGWVYGTVQYERRVGEPKVGEGWFIPRVTSAGRVAGCMGCHTRAPHGRLFGLPSR